MLSEFYERHSCCQYIVLILDPLVTFIDTHVFEQNFKKQIQTFNLIIAKGRSSTCTNIKLLTTMFSNTLKPPQQTFEALSTLSFWICKSCMMYNPQYPSKS